ncbi:hypothetical protein V2J09_018256, partial [Rumex salicifolius]
QGESRHRIEAELERVRREEQGKYTAELNNAIAKVQSQFQREQQEVINNLQQQEKKCSSLVASLRV